VLERVRRAERAYLRELDVRDDADDQSFGPGVLLAFAYPDRIGKRRSGDEAR
jgi:hypothetical protein